MTDVTHVASDRATKYVVVRFEKWSPVSGMMIKCFGPVDSRKEAFNVLNQRSISGLEIAVYELETP